MEGPTGCEALWPAPGPPAQADGKASFGQMVALDLLFPGAQQTSSSAAPAQQPCFYRAGSEMSTTTHWQEDHTAGALASSQGESQQLPDYSLLPCGVQPGMPFELACLLDLPCQPQSAPTAAGSLDAAGLDAAPTGTPLSTGFAETSAAADPPIISFEEALLERFCSSCLSLLPEGDGLADNIIRANGRADGLKIQAAKFILKAVRGCNKVASFSCPDSSSEGEPPPVGTPCLFADLEMLASRSIGRCWGVAQSKARGAEPGRRRARNGTPQAWNVNWNTNSPLLLPQQTELLSFLASGSSSSGGAHDGEAAALSGSSGELYAIRSTDNKAGITAYAVVCNAVRRPVPAVTISTAAGPGVVAGRGSSQQGVVDCTDHLWCNNMICSKKSHALYGAELSLFRYCFVVLTTEQE